MVHGACAYQIAAVIVLKQREGDDEPESDRGDLKKFKVGQCAISSQKPQQPQTSETDSSPAVKGNGKARVRKPKPKKTTIIRTRWSQEEEKLLAETWIL